MTDPSGLPVPHERAAPWRAIAVAAGAILVAVVVAALVLRGGEDGQATLSPANPTASAPASVTPVETTSSSPNTSSGASAEPAPSAIPEAFTRVATFAGASSFAMTAWSQGWAVIGRTGTGAAVWLSADGTTWDEGVPTGLDDGSVNHVVTIPDGRLLAFGFRDDGSLGGVPATWVSSDGLGWEAIDIGIPDLVNAVDVAAGPLGLVIVGRGEINEAGDNAYAWYSSDGISWEQVWESVEAESPSTLR